MSLSGMLVETVYPLKVNSRYHIEIFLEKNILELIGRVAYCEEINPGKDKKYNIGIEFAKMTNEKRDLIKNFLKTL
jgi:hypothetical protein